MSDKPLGSLKTRGKNGCVGTRVTASEAVMQHDIHYNDVVVIQGFKDARIFIRQ